MICRVWGVSSSGCVNLGEADSERYSGAASAVTFTCGSGRTWSGPEPVSAGPEARAEAGSPRARAVTTEAVRGALLRRRVALLTGCLRLLMKVMDVPLGGRWASEWRPS